jgi:predicted dehydrogenase
MSKKINIGIIGCGTIANVYMTNITQHYTNLELVAVGDIFVEKAKEAAEKFNVPKACTVDELLAIDEIEIVLNLTIPAAHYEVDMKVLNAGKHLYSEKPLTLDLEEGKKVVALAKEKGLMAVSAPDTFLGAGASTCRKLVDEGRIGNVIGFSANMTCPGHELWHPAPGFYYKNGGGPMFDMGPYYITTLVSILGPIKRISCFTTIGRPERNILGSMTKTEVPTHYSGIMEFENGAVGNINMSFETWDSTLPCLELYGTKGSLTVPDPDSFSGVVTLFDGTKLKQMVDNVTDPHPAKIITMVTRKGECKVNQPLTFSYDPDPHTNMRGLGVSDMAQSLIDKRPARLSADISLHVVEALNAFAKSAETGTVYEMTTTCERTAPMGEDWALWEVR